jgi:hypothetical protein
MIVVPVEHQSVPDPRTAVVRAELVLEVDDPGTIASDGCLLDFK